MDRKLDDTLHGSLVITYLVVIPPQSEFGRGPLYEKSKRVRLFTTWCTQATARAEFERFCKINPELRPELLDAEFIHRGHVH